MSTLSIPISSEQERFIRDYIKEGKAENKSQVVRRALARLAEDEAVAAVLRAQKEPILRGNLRTLMHKLK